MNCPPIYADRRAQIDVNGGAPNPRTPTRKNKQK